MFTIVPVDAGAQELWRVAAGTAYGMIRGNVIPAGAFDEALKYRDEYRRQNAMRKGAVAAAKTAGWKVNSGTRQFEKQ